MYPKFMYSKEFPKGKIFETMEKEKAAGEGWYESPAEIPEEETVKKKGK